MRQGVRLPAAGGGHWVMVAPERLERWLDGFAARHGPVRWEAGPLQVVGTAADGARAECEVGFPPLAVDDAAPWGGLIAHASRERTLGVLLVRLGGYAAGVFAGPRLVASKVGSRPVHGRTAAGGWSQQRFARRREGQARAALEAAVAAAEGIVLRHEAELDALVAGGDRRAVRQVLADPRLAALLPLLGGRHIDAPGLGQRGLVEAHQAALQVRIRVHDGDWVRAQRLS